MFDKNFKNNKSKLRFLDFEKVRMIRARRRRNIFGGILRQNADFVQTSTSGEPQKVRIIKANQKFWILKK